MPGILTCRIETNEALEFNLFLILEQKNIAHYPLRKYQKCFHLDLQSRTKTFEKKKMLKITNPPPPKKSLDILLWLL